MATGTLGGLPERIALGTSDEFYLMVTERSDGPYTTIPVSEYTHLQDILLALRKKQQITREFLEKGQVQEALELLRLES